MQETWAKISLTVEREDGGIVDAELIRPRSWIDGNGIRAGQLLPLNIAELQIAGFAHVTAVDPCPQISSGEGSVITGLFTTRQVDIIARAEILSADGQIEIIEGTTIHPIWSVDRQDWVSLGELGKGESLHAADGLAIVASILIASQVTPVYNIEVHGEHVYRVGDLAILAHNAAPLRCAMIAEWGDEAMQAWQAAHIIPKNGWGWAPDALHQVIANVTKAGLIDDIANGFASTAGHGGTHTKAYVDDVVEIMDGLTDPQDIISGINELWGYIEAGKYL